MSSRTKEYFKSMGTVAKWWDIGEGVFSVMFPEQESEISLMLSELQSKKVIDLGCGKGRLLPLLARLEAEIYACDISREMITLSKNRQPLIHYVLCDAENLPFRGGVFDGLLCIESLTHFPNVEKAIYEIGRITKKGAFVVASYGGFTFYVLWHDAMAGAIDWYLKRKSDKLGHWTSPTRYRHFFRRRGFRLERSRGVGIIPCLSCVGFHLPPLKLYHLLLRSERILRKTLFHYLSTWVIQKWRK